MKGELEAQNIDGFKEIPESKNVAFLSQKQQTKQANKNKKQKKQTNKQSAQESQKRAQPC